MTLTAAQCEPAPDALTLDEQLDEVIARAELRAVIAPDQDPARVKLGQMLFFDQELSGNRDTSCATCHHPTLQTGDAVPLSVGTGSTGLGAARLLGEGREWAPRNAPALFDLGDPAWRVQFWDGRVERFASGEVRSPAQGSLPAGLESVLAVQAMFPVTSRDEMRGDRGDVDRFGAENEIAAEFDSDMIGIWGALMRRLLANEEYVELFAQAYPGVEVNELGFEHAANAIAAFEIAAFSLDQSPWDRYLRGEREALSEQAKRGALVFYGEGGCAGCHSGALMTDQAFHGLAVPQLGPGKLPDQPLDQGRSRISADPRDAFTFRTPPLRHVAYTAPYMHNGSLATLEQVIAHHIDPERSLREYDPMQLEDEVLRATVVTDPAIQDRLLAQRSEKLAGVGALDASQVADLVVFLEALGDPGVERLQRWVPERVPSGLEVEVGEGY